MLVGSLVRGDTHAAALVVPFVGHDVLSPGGTNTNQRRAFVFNATGYHVRPDLESVLTVARTTVRETLVSVLRPLLLPPPG